jgi:MFS superfamily sulfate permease-like transporter
LRLFRFSCSTSHIPLSVIAAILVFVAYRMIEHEHFIRMFKHDKGDRARGGRGSLD